MSGTLRHEGIGDDMPSPRGHWEHLGQASLGEDGMLDAWRVHGELVIRRVGPGVADCGVLVYQNATGYIETLKLLEKHGVKLPEVVNMELDINIAVDGISRITSER